MSLLLPPTDDWFTEWLISPGLVNNSILVCWIFTFKDQCNFKYIKIIKVSVNWFLSDITRCALKGAMSAQKALQGSKTKTRESLEGTDEIDILPNKFAP